jgi:hypothetical protein
MLYGGLKSDEGMGKAEKTLVTAIERWFGSKAKHGVAGTMAP